MSPIFFVNNWPITRYPHTKHFQTYLHSSPKQLLEIDTKLSSFRRCIVKAFGVWYQMQCYELIMFQVAIYIYMQYGSLPQIGQHFIQLSHRGFSCPPGARSLPSFLLSICFPTSPPLLLFLFSTEGANFLGM